MSDQYKNLKLMQNVRLALPEVEALQSRMDTINLLLVGSGVDAKYVNLDNPARLLGIDDKYDREPGTEDYFLELKKLLEKLLKQLEEDMFAAQELRNLGQKVEI